MLDRIRITPKNLDAIKAMFIYRGLGPPKNPTLQKREWYLELPKTHKRAFAVYIVDDEMFDKLLIPEDVPVQSSIKV